MRPSMGQETNIELIRDLERQIEEGKGDIIQLKRARNSLLNISVLVPPEILGHIFVLVVAFARSYSLHPGIHFAGLERGSYSFLLVCSHWFKVASGTPELWSFWGNALHDWENRYRHPGTAPVDLVLYGCGGRPEILSVPLQEALRHRTAENRIRQIHLDSSNLDLLTVIISSLTPDGEGAQERNVESIILRTMGTLPELSKFFARTRLPMLRHLHFAGVLQTPLWDLLASPITRLTTLEFILTRPSLPPTASQLTSILLSNSNLQELTLSDAALPADVDDSKVRVPLRRLTTLVLAGKFRRVFGLLQRLELPETLDYTKLILDDSTVEEGISRTLGSYMQDRLRHDDKFQDKLNFTSLCGYVKICVDGRLGHPPWLEQMSRSPRFTMSIVGPSDEVIKKLTLDLMTFALDEHVVYLETEYSLGIQEELFDETPKIEMLWLRNPILSEGFLQPDPSGKYANAKFLPSLRSLHLENVIADDGWKPLLAFLTRQASHKQKFSLELLGSCSRVPQRVTKEIQGLVEKLICDRMLNAEDSDEDEVEDREGEWKGEEDGWS